ncbi:hypothetical protein V6N13_099468 [Hibiscus sabdariffa]|uniref:Uncharacterized protein n=1 Tax=Hibiscus sabdariffa TaxID=183260 RepID=A0ABR2PZR9_9ROSI
MKTELKPRFLLVSSGDLKVSKLWPPYPSSSTAIEGPRSERGKGYGGLSSETDPRATADPLTGGAEGGGGAEAYVGRSFPGMNGSRWIGIFKWRDEIKPRGNIWAIQLARVMHRIGEESRVEAGKPRVGGRRVGACGAPVDLDRWITL